MRRASLARGTREDAEAAHTDASHDVSHGRHGRIRARAFLQALPAPSVALCASSSAGSVNDSLDQIARSQKPFFSPAAAEELDEAE